jgi:hypothetical protein
MGMSAWDGTQGLGRDTGTGMGHRVRHSRYNRGMSDTASDPSRVFRDSEGRKYVLTPVVTGPRSRVDAGWTWYTQEGQPVRIVGDQFLLPDGTELWPESSA